MKKLAKKLTALALSAAMLTVPAGAITANGESETWFDGVWALIDAFGLKAENDPYVLQNYINKYLEEHPEEIYQVVNDILSLLDTHSMYLSSEEYSKGFSTLEGYVGIGVGLQQLDGGGVAVGEVMRNSSAEEAGLQVGDVFVAIDGADASAMTSAEVAEQLRGAEGSSLTLTVRRGGRELTLTCTRRQVNYVYVSNQTLADGVEYIKVSAMGSENDWEAFDEVWQGLDEKNTRAVLLDLRGNGGGLIDIAIRMADCMVQKEGAYLAGIRYREDMGGLEQYESSGGALPLNKIVVLVDGGTASAAELLAGCLKDTGTATLVGTQTYGKGQGQFHIPLVNGDKLVITTLQMELPKTGAYEGVGITPNIILDNQQITVNAASLSALDTETPLYFGTRSQAVYAMTERLAMLGLLDTATEVFDGAVLDALHSFCNSYELAPLQYASPQMLAALDEAMQTLDGESYQIDLQLQTALAMCEAAAAEPQQYTALEDGSWRSK